MQYPGEAERRDTEPARPAKVFVINLDRQPDRWEAMSEQLTRLGIGATRIPAIDKHKLRIDDPALDRLPKGPVACLRSHYRAVETFLDTDASAALIMEDDVEIGTEIVELISDLSWWPPGYGLVKLQSAIRPEILVWLGKPVGSTNFGRLLRPIRHSALGSYGYLIDRETAWRIKGLTPAGLHMPIDHVLFDLKNSWIARRLHPLQMIPGAIRHLPYEVFGSEIGDAEIGRRKLWKASRAFRVYHHVFWIANVVSGNAKIYSIPFAP